MKLILIGFLAFLFIYFLPEFTLDAFQLSTIVLFIYCIYSRIQKYRYKNSKEYKEAEAKRIQELLEKQKLINELYEAYLSSPNCKAFAVCPDIFYKYRLLEAKSNIFSYDNKITFLGIPLIKDENQKERIKLITNNEKN